MPPRTNDGVRVYVENGGWNHEWTEPLVKILKDGYQAGKGVHALTDEVFLANGPSKWENVRDKLKQLFPGEHIRGDLRDAKAPLEESHSKEPEAK